MTRNGHNGTKGVDMRLHYTPGKLKEINCYDANGESGTYAKYMADAIFKVPTPQLLEKIVTALDEMYELIDKQPDKQDARGDLEAVFTSVSARYAGEKF